MRMGGVVKTFSVLLIDDDKENQEIFKVVLVEQHHLPLVIANTVDIGLNTLEKFKPDIIVIDLYWTGPNGYDFRRQATQGELNPHCPIVATTAYYTHYEAGQVLLSGFD